MAIGGEWIWRKNAVMSLTFEVVFLDVLDEIFKTAIVVLGSRFLTGLSVHITTILLLIASI